jgi:hypothetical protein
MWKYENADIRNNGYVEIRVRYKDTQKGTVATVYEIYFVQEKYEATTGHYI